MLNLTRVVAAVYTAAATVAAVYLGWEKVLVVTGGITTAASFLANMTKDGTWYDAILSGLAINVTAKTAVAPPPVGLVGK